jgi:transposase InsO family protein
MESVTRIEVAWELRQAGQRVEYIAERVGADRATLYRWFRGVRQRGIRGFIRHYKQAKKGHRHRKTHSYVEQRVLALRREHHSCCGEKIVYWLAKEGINLSRSTVYRVLNKHLQLRGRGHRNVSRGSLPKASGPREVIQMDTVDFGGVFAFTAIDIYTREGQVVLQPGITAMHGQAALKTFMAYFGRCQIIQTDGGSEFEADFAQLVPAYADQHRIARPYKKNEQAFIECFNLTVRKECLGWEKYAPHQILPLQTDVQTWLHYYHFVRPSMAFQPMRPIFISVSHLI